MILYVDANTLYGLALFQVLRYDENEMWHGHPDF